jgi:septal ring factor EnvC (AmiA/AmiB activator)
VRKPCDLTPDNANLDSLSAQLKELGADVAKLKTGPARLRASQHRLASNFARLKENVIRLDKKLQAFQEHRDDRFDELSELLEGYVRKWKAEISALKFEPVPKSR